MTPIRKINEVEIRNIEHPYITWRKAIFLWISSTRATKLTQVDSRKVARDTAGILGDCSGYKATKVLPLKVILSISNQTEEGVS